MTDQLTVSAAERRASLLAGKLAALVRRHGGSTEVASDSFALGAGLLAGEVAWVLLDGAVDDGRGLGAALAWALRRGAEELDIVADVPLGVAARRAAEFDLPVRVWCTSDGELVPVDPSPISTPADPPVEHLRFLPDIEAAGATPNIEHGILGGEVRGLEVCRVVDVETGLGGATVRLEVGIGAHDRDAFAMIHGDVPTRDALGGVVASVSAVRALDAPGHPLNRLAPERLLRWRLEQEPWLVDMASVAAAPPPVPRGSLKDRAPCSAIGRRLDGSAVVIVCSVGVDLDVIPYAADARLAAGSEPGVLPSVIVVLPERDVVRVTTELSEHLLSAVTLTPLQGANT